MSTRWLLEDRQFGRRVSFLCTHVTKLAVRPKTSNLVNNAFPKRQFRASKNESGINAKVFARFPTKPSITGTDRLCMKNNITRQYRPRSHPRIANHARPDLARVGGWRERYRLSFLPGLSACPSFKVLFLERDRGRGVLPRQIDLDRVPHPFPYVDRRTDTSENITFPHTTHVVGNKLPFYRAKTIKYEVWWSRLSYWSSTSQTAFNDNIGGLMVHILSVCIQKHCWFT